MKIRQTLSLTITYAIMFLIRSTIHTLFTYAFMEIPNAVLW